VVTYLAVEKGGDTLFNVERDAKGNSQIWGVGTAIKCGEERPQMEDGRVKANATNLLNGGENWFYITDKTYLAPY